MNTFNKMWPDVHTPAEAQKKIDEQKAEAMENLRIDDRDSVTNSQILDNKKYREPINLEEQALCLVGKESSTSLSRNIQRRNGNVTARNCQLSSSSVFLCV